MDPENERNRKKLKRKNIKKVTRMTEDHRLKNVIGRATVSDLDHAIKRKNVNIHDHHRDLVIVIVQLMADIDRHHTLPHRPNVEGPDPGQRTENEKTMDQAEGVAQGVRRDQGQGGTQKIQVLGHRDHLEEIVINRETHVRHTFQIRVR